MRESESFIENDLYMHAVTFVTENQTTSVSAVQRHFRIGYNAAVRLLERMEKEGIVSGYVPEKGRQVLITNT